MEMQMDPIQLASDARFNAVTGILVVDRLVLCAPDDLTADQKKAVREMVAERDAVAAVREDRAMNQPARVRPLIAPFNASWNGLSSALAALCSLPNSVGKPRITRAERVRATLFPEDGVPSLQVDAETAYVQAQERIERMEREDIEGELVDLVGREYVDAIKTTTAALGEILGVGRTPRPIASGPAMQIALKRLSRSASRYARKLLADLDEEDEASVARFTSALAPLIQHKLTPRQSSDDENEEVIVPQPTPVVTQPSPVPSPE